MYKGLWDTMGGFHLHPFSFIYIIFNLVNSFLDLFAGRLTFQIITQMSEHYQFEQDKAHSTVMGIICPMVEIGSTVTQNLGKARALEALVAVAPMSSFLISL